MFPLTGAQLSSSHLLIHHATPRATPSSRFSFSLSLARFVSFFQPFDNFQFCGVKNVATDVFYWIFLCLRLTTQFSFFSFGSVVAYERDSCSVRVIRLIYRNFFLFFFFWLINHVSCVESLGSHVDLFDKLEIRFDLRW